MKKYYNTLRLLLIIPLLFLLPTCVSARNLTCDHLPVLMEEFLANHYAMKRLDDGIRNNTVDQMIKRLDITKTLLYEADVEKLKRDIMGMFVTMQDGNCSALEGVYSLLLTRARENEKFVKKFLGPDYKLDENVELDTDLDKRPYPKTRSEKEDILRKYVHFQIANLLLAGHSLEEARKQQIHHYELQTKRLSERQAGKLVTSFTESFALALDPHSSYLSPENMEDFRIKMQLSLEGIGAALSSENGFTVIEELIPGGGAERSGVLKPKDKIIAVAQEGEKPVNVIDMDLKDVIRKIRGKKGTKVTLTILRQADRMNRFTVTIVRDTINIKEQEAKLTYETRQAGRKKYVFGVIDLPSFYGGGKDGKSCYKDVKNLLTEAKGKKVDGIVLNLSRNGGGLLSDAVRVAGLFLDRGGVVATKDGESNITILANGINAQKSREDKRRVLSHPREDRAAVFTGPLVVITSRLSASASEIVAGALKDYGRAVIVGADHTFGKGSVQTMTPLAYGLGAISVTTQMYFLPGGKSTQKEGVAADIILPGLFSSEKIGESVLDYPLPAQAIPPFIHSLGESSRPNPAWRQVDPSLIAALSKKSAARVAGDAKFAEIIKTEKEIAGRKGIIRVSDLQKESKKEAAQKKEGRPEEKIRKKTDERESTYVAEGVNILLDMVTAKPAAAAGIARH